MCFEIATRERSSDEMRVERCVQDMQVPSLSSEEAFKYRTAMSC